ncbi:MAG: hypothetical protein R3F13_15150 [Prosthecobacter sp.]
MPAHPIQSEAWQFFIARLSEFVAEPSDDHPTVRVWKDSELIWLINQIAQQHKGTLKTTFPSGSEVLKSLLKMGWLRKLSLVGNSTGRELYLMDLEASKDEGVDVLEVLQAYLPSGVISYFSALGFHELTTQIPAFAHIGRLANGHPPESTGDVLVSETKPMGRRLFDHDGIECFETKRYKGLTPGVQTRMIGPRTNFRITTLEQTLLDTLIQPLRCGGEAVVFEAWGQVKERANLDRMADHLKAIGRDTLVRRVGAMLKMYGIIIQEDSSLGQLLIFVKNNTADTDEVIPLLPGLSYPITDGAWKVNMP